MKSHNKHIPYYLCLALLLLITNVVHAQSNSNKNTADSASAKIAQKLSVSPEKARQIHAAYSYNLDKITKLEKDTTLKGPGKIRLLNKLRTERKRQIDSTVTPAQKAAMIADQGDLYKKQMAARAQMIKRHEDEMNRIPHKRTVKTTVPDTIRNKSNTKTH